MMTICEVRGLCKTYPAFTLSDASFSLEAGRVTGFIGRNGAGKTTTIKSMLNIVHPSSGEIFFFGMSISENEKEIKENIGYSSGAVNYYPKKKIRDLAATAKSFYKNWDEAAYKEYLRLFSLDENKSPSELSDGMRVKVNLLLALSHGAKLLILDEPTSGLDPFSRDELTDLFIKLRSRGIAVLFSTHIISDLEKCADNIIYIQNGKIISCGEKAEFIKKFGEDGETLEQIILRLERSVRDEESAF